MHRLVLTDIKPPVFHRLTAEKGEQINRWVISSLEEYLSDIKGGFFENFKEYYNNPKFCEKEKKILESAHYLATKCIALLNIMGLDFSADNSANDGLVDDLMNLLIDLRKQARAEKNYAMADQIRNQLNEIGVVLEDTKQGTTWKRK